MKSKIGWASSCPLPAKQAATLATTATSIADDKRLNELSKWWDIESYASNCDVTGHSKDEQRSIKTLEQTTRFNGERYGSWTSVARGRSEINKQLLLCNGSTQVPRTTPEERRNAKKSATKKPLTRTSTPLRSES